MSEEPLAISEIYSDRDWGSHDAATEARVKRFGELSGQGYVMEPYPYQAKDGEWPLRMYKFPIPTRITPEGEEERGVSEAQYEHRVVNGLPRYQRTATNVLNDWERHGWEVVNVIPRDISTFDIWIRRPNPEPPAECWDKFRDTWYDFIMEGSEGD